MLSSHLEMLHSARNAARDDDNVAQIISSMLEKTNRLASQFRVVRKQIVCLCHFFIFFFFSSSCANMRTEKWWADLNSNTFTDGTYNMWFVWLGNRTRSESTTPGDANSAATEKSNLFTGKKRARAEIEAINMTTDSAQENFSQKRKRLSSILSCNNEDMRSVTPVSIETEDISEEVQRRLEIKEEQRKKRGSSTSEKRKRDRDSLASNDNTSSSFGSASRPKKRRRGYGATKID